MRRLLPFLDWLPKYGKSWFAKDLVAGLSVGILLVPQGMAYAMIAGMPPVYGLYAALVPILVYAFLGTSRQLAVGPVAMDSLLVAAGLGTLALTGVESYISMALLLAFMVGVIQFTLGMLRMGFLANFLSRPVISGFTSAAALIIIFSQLKHFFGVNIPQTNQFHKSVINVVSAVPETNLYALLIGVVGIALIVLLKRWNKKIPAILVVVIAGILAVYLFGLESYRVNIVGDVPEGLPRFRLPEFSWPKIKGLFSIALAIALIGYTEAIGIGKAIEEQNDEETIDPNKELLAFGSANIIGSFFQSYLASASFSRSAINNTGGAKTPIASLVSMLLVALTLLFFTGLFYYLPIAALASIIMVSVVGLIDVAYPKILWKYRKDEFVVLLATFFITLSVGLPEGILLGVLLSLLVTLYRSSRPHFAVLGQIKGSEYFKNVNRFRSEIEFRSDLLILRFDSQLYFGNKDYFRKQLFRYINGQGSSLKGIILNAEPINYIDSSAAEMLAKTIREIQERGIDFYIASAIGPTRDTIFNSRIIDVLPKEHLFGLTKEAVDFFDNPDSLSKVGDKVAQQSRFGK
ncbi:solute carrier family 26 protein [Pricia sp. S334]|uniref:Solute carrier family 26 protein n=1 Tax=Pricia mediterranea TaxID=3076079 RepID=A0ABU3L329_9FLAO|nr:solute carrier family 26 protein [Pricia sp. S334]MDT7827803.1 solute carrier family 26 protein [Pricia sp. S334]